jgi:hypothetical protein
MPECDLTLPCSSTCTNCISGSTEPAFQINNPVGLAIVGFGLTGGLQGSVDPLSSGTGVQGGTVRGIGVLGTSSEGVGVNGAGGAIGVQGDTDTGRAGSFHQNNVLNDNVALYAETRGRGPAIEGVINNAGNNQPALRGSTNGSGPGVEGNSTSGIAVIGNSASNTGVAGRTADGTGVIGNSAGGFLSAGVLGNSDGGFFVTGVLGTSSAQTGVGVFGRGQFRAGFFEGDVQVTGSLIKPGGGFRIDHPLEPAHKYLSHSFVESPDMKNVYDGVVALDEHGECRVELPEWFEALNCDFPLSAHLYW